MMSLSPITRTEHTGNNYRGKMAQNKAGWSKAKTQHQPYVTVSSVQMHCRF